jgi:hypothetical protein
LRAWAQFARTGFIVQEKPRLLGISWRESQRHGIY